MRIGGGDFHLTYCTNVHPGEDWPAVQNALARYTLALKGQLAPESSFAAGLRLSDAAARDLLRDGALVRFRDWLAAHGLYVPIINGFPYGGFHGQTVKDRVYAPDWRDPARLAYTQRLVEILSVLVPEGLDGGISTVPLSYKPWLRTPGERDSAREACVAPLIDCAEMLIRLRDARGMLLHLDIEPEPDGLLENAEEVVAFWHDVLLAQGAPAIAQRLGLTRTAAEERLLEHLRLCYDACHFAVAYEQPDAALTRLDAAGIRLGRLQVSSALQVNLPADAGGRGALGERLRCFADSTYLHQTVARYADGTLRHYVDLPEALANIGDPAARSWRIHFHVPVFLAGYHELGSTQDDLAATLDAVIARRACRHLEIETYTFDVLPPEVRSDAVESIAREYRWVLSRIVDMQGVATRVAAAQ